MRRGWIIGSAVVCLLGSLVWGKPGIVRTTDKQSYEGDITEKENSVVVTVRGVKMVVPRDKVTAIVYTQNVADEFQARLAKLDAKDVKGRIDLAYWAVERQQYPLARQALEEALAIDPNNKDAVTFLDVVDRQARMRPTTNERGTTPPAAAGGREDIQPPVTGPAGRAELLTNDDINMIRLMELKETDTAARLRIDMETRRRYAAAKREPLNRVTEMRPLDLGLAIRDGDEARDLRSEVRVLNDPAALAEYRTRIQPTVLNNCAASGCHSGNSGGGLVLLTPASTEAVTYTNFFILNKYARKVESAGGNGGAFSGPALRYMIDRTRPQESLMVQYGLPAHLAQYPHKAVANLRPMFQSREDANYRRMVDWIANLRTPAPDYEIRYQPPTASTQPTSQPAGR